MRLESERPIRKLDGSLHVSTAVSLCECGDRQCEGVMRIGLDATERGVSSFGTSFCPGRPSPLDESTKNIRLERPGIGVAGVEIERLVDEAQRLPQICFGEIETLCKRAKIKVVDRQIICRLVLRSANLRP